MERKIIQKLKEIQSEQGIKILFAVESGSRSWGLESADSDYDVRFVYARPQRDYFKINKQADVLTYAYDKELNPHSVEGSEIDMLGFDIYKFTRLLLSSNPSMIEWLESEIPYIIDPLDTKIQLKEFVEKKFNPVALYHHYRSMCKQNYLKYLKSNNLMTHKKYLYAMRGLVNALYVVEYVRVPPIRFQDTLVMMVERMPLSIIQKLNQIIKVKKTANEKDKIEKIPSFETYIESFLKEEERLINRRIIGYEDIQNHIYKIFGFEALEE